VADGGLLVALAEMALAGAVGCAIEASPGGPLHAYLFGEDQGRYVVATTDPVAVLAAARAAGVPAAVMGRTMPGDASGAATLTLNGAPLISLAELREVHESWLPTFMGGA
jgi:phosphoribosylformylglycinamidine synthase